MTNIHNLQDLRAEKKRVEALALQQKNLIKQDINEIKESLQPANLLLNAVSHLTGIEFDNKTFLKNWMAYGLSILVQQYFLKAEQKVEEKFHEITISLVEKVKEFVQSFLHKNENQNTQKETN